MIILLVVVVALGVGLGILLGRARRAPARPGRQGAAGFGTGRLDERLPVDSTDESGQIAIAVNAAADRLATAMRDIDASAQTLASASEELTATAAQMSAAASDSAAQATIVSDAAGTRVLQRAHRGRGLGGDGRVDPRDRHQRQRGGAGRRRRR